MAVQLPLLALLLYRGPSSDHRVEVAPQRFVLGYFAQVALGVVPLHLAVPVLVRVDLVLLELSDGDVEAACCREV